MDLGDLGYSQEYHRGDTLCKALGKSMHRIGRHDADVSSTGGYLSINQVSVLQSY